MGEMQIKSIGIVGGVGPYAGLDLNRKIFDHTRAASDQEHLPVLLASYSVAITDRTRYLREGDVENPALGLFKVIKMLDAAGAAVVGIPCNTAHADRIFSRIEALIAEHGLSIKLLNMISEVTMEIQTTLAKGIAVGVISTLGTRQTRLYEHYLEQADIPVILPEQALAEEVHAAIYHPDFGIKAHSNPVQAQARDIAIKAIRELARQGANAVILGCTELPLAVDVNRLDGIALIDPSTVLARALIRETYPERLKPRSGSKPPRPLA